MVSMENDCNEETLEDGSQSFLGFFKCFSMRHFCKHP